jgi:hypothetical protein
LSSAALVLAVVGLPASQRDSTASITGHVKLTRTRGIPLPSNIYQPRNVGDRGLSRPPDIQNVVVYLMRPAFRGTLPLTRSAIRQEREEFTPRVVVITRGSTIDFPNADPIFHNVFSLSGAATFDLGRFPQGHSRSVTFTKPGLVKVFCHLHSHMSASILVLDHPYFAIPNQDGTFTLPSVPAGKHTVVGWHERVGERSTTVEVQPGGATSVEIVLPVEDAR